MSSNCLISVNSFVLICSLILCMFGGWFIIKEIYDKYVQKKSTDPKIISILCLFTLVNFCILIYSYTNSTTCEKGQY